MFKKIFTAIVIVFAIIGFVFTAVFVGMQFKVFNVRGSIAERNQFFLDGTQIATQPCEIDSEEICEWNQTPEWDVIKNALVKDIAVIDRVSAETGVSSRMIAAVVVPEQIRFFTSDREIFKSYFEPLKILVSLSQFSLGVSGIKQETATDIETYAASTTSPFYPGYGMAQKVVYADGIDKGVELYNRLTDPKDHYYSYLYTALFIKEVEAQWKKAGFDITQSPEAVATLFNLGFQASHPKASPQIGGAPITVGGITYLYGELGSKFYHSDELGDVFPK